MIIFTETLKDICLGGDGRDLVKLQLSSDVIMKFCKFCLLPRWQTVEIRNGLVRRKRSKTRAINSISRNTENVW